jgi:hypothetical protein
MASLVEEDVDNVLALVAMQKRQKDGNFRNGIVSATSVTSDTTSRARSSEEDDGVAEEEDVGFLRRGIRRNKMWPGFAYQVLALVRRELIAVSARPAVCARAELPLGSLGQVRSACSR